MIVLQLREAASELDSLFTFTEDNLTPDKGSQGAFINDGRGAQVRPIRGWVDNKTQVKIIQREEVKV